MARQFGKGGTAMLHELLRYGSMQVTMGYYAYVDDAFRDVMNGLTTQFT